MKKILRFITQRLVITALLIVLQALLLYRSGKQAPRQDDEALKEWVRQQLDAQSKLFAQQQAELARQNYDAMRGISETLQTAVQGMSSTLNAGQAAQQQTMEQRLQGLEASIARKLEEMRKTLAESMAALQAQNAQKLDEIRCTVDEQLQDALQKRVTESFKAVNAQLEQVYKGLGELQCLAADVGGLIQVLSGVKTRGILGEIQLGAILEEILAPEQYDTNVATIPGSTQRVEYAINMPGADGGSVWLPIDSKFPGDTYAHLQDAQTSGDAQAVENARHALELVLRSEAKDIREKYVEPPYTTAFGILFLPFAGLYAAVVNAGLLEELRSLSDPDDLTGESGTGICLIGNSEVYSRMLGKQEAQFAQQFSRVRFRRRYSTADVKLADVEKLFPTLADGSHGKELAFMTGVCRSKWGIRGAMSVYTNAVRNENTSLDGLRGIAASMGVGVLS